ncbi:MAG: saccharopine dehydrogenase NADP-binding domain-containing protein [Polyangiaceae bacterium]|nr:saccharopine dehydrogenase NADP-binding domain-containing protein [Polyangiaceae bacterium]
MRALVLGAGRMGSAAAWDLARQPGMKLVRILDCDTQRLAACEHHLARLLASPRRESARIETEPCDLDREPALQRRFTGFDVVLAATDYRHNRALTAAAIEARVHLCDLGGNNAVVQAQLALDEEAQHRGVCVIPDTGLAPGLACMLAALGVERLGRAHRVAIRVGGLPAHPRPPLAYKIAFSVRGLTNEYLEPAEIIRDGETAVVPSLDESERLEFPPPFDVLEAFTTSGGSSTLPRTLRTRARHLDYKTIRYPGHGAVFAALRDLGFFAESPVEGVVPRAFSERLLERALTDDDTDVVLLRVVVEGERNGTRTTIVFEAIDRQDGTTGHSAMARTTGYSAAAVAYMLAAGAITRRGVVPGELALPLEEYLAAVRARGLAIVERTDTE